MSEKTNLVLSSSFEWLGITGKKQKAFLVHLAIFLFGMLVILIIDPTGFRVDIIEGKPAPRTIRSPKLISFVDDHKTNELRSNEMEKVQPVYNTIDRAEEKMFENFDRFVMATGDFYRELTALPPSEPPQALIASYFPSETLLEPEMLLQLRNLKPFQIERLQTAPRRILRNFSQRVITSQNIVSIKAEVRSSVDSYPESANFKLVMTSLIRNAIMVNAIEDEQLTRQRRESAGRAIQPVKRIFQKGQKIIDEGVIVTADDYFVVKKISEQLHRNRLQMIMGNLLLALLATTLCLVYLKLENHHILKEPAQYKLLGVLCLLALALSKAAHGVGAAFDDPYLAVLITPLPAIALLMTMLLEPNIAFFNIVIMSLMTFVVADINIKFVVISLFGAFAGILSWRTASKSSDVRGLVGISGVKIGVASAIAILAFLLIDTESFANMSLSQISLLIAFGFFNGIISAILANGVLPYMESLFSLATSSRLLELADLSQPLLRRLAEEAPGTYQHSIAVATLAEAAANGVNADPLLTKVSAYFHDIGKLRRPAYFSENQSEENRHDQITPYMSSLILICHVRDSIDLGREYGLPERVLSIMSQHHGTTLISYFFDEAKKMKDSEAVSEDRFRYPGPKPQTKEAAIVMLADSVEAAARTLKQYTHSKVEVLVQKIIEHKLNDENQLDESDLTLKDIEKIEQIFVRTITSMYHGRIDYPGKLSNQPEGSS